MTGMPSTHAANQYASSTGRLDARIAIHRYGTYPQDWFSWLDERLPLTGDVLEAGAGTGRLWQRVDHKGRGLRLTLTDFSSAMCIALRTAVPAARVQRCDAAALPFAQASFDTVVANHMLYHLDDPDEALREFARVLRPGGRLAVAVNGREHLAELAALGPAVGRPDVRLASRFNDVTAETVPGYVSRRFSNVAVERYPGDLVVPSAEPVLAYLASMADAPLTAEQEAAARALVEARIDVEGGLRVRKHTVLVTATR